MEIIYIVTHLVMAACVIIIIRTAISLERSALRQVWNVKKTKKRLVKIKPNADAGPVPQTDRIYHVAVPES